MLTRQNKLRELNENLENSELDFIDKMDKFIEAKGEDYVYEKINKFVNKIVAERNLKHIDYKPKDKNGEKDGRQ